MGAWGTGNWENDDALDWIADLSSMSDVEAALAGPTNDAGSCCQALAAAEVVAACLGRPSQDLPDEIEAWVARNRGTCAAGLAATAARSVQAIESSSELQQLFDDGQRDEEWHSVLGELLSRLSAP